MNTPQQVLGLPPGATFQEAKKAWRAAAKELHPDTGKHPDASAFVEAHTAWKTLETQLRNLPPPPPPRLPPPPPVPPGTPKHVPFLAQPGPSMQGMHLRHTLVLSEARANSGGSTEVLLTYPLVCTECAGETEMETDQLCTACNGVGRHHPGAPDCHNCHGTGHLFISCPTCSGRGFVPHRAAATVSWPANVRQGQSWRVPRGGAPGRGSGAPGDLHVDVHITN